MKPRAIHFTIIPRRDNDGETEPYKLLGEIRRAHHLPIAEARIALAWRDEYSMDADGRVVLGKCVKVTALHQQFTEYDFIIVLNRVVWDSPEFTEAQKRALIDHELCHAAIAEDKHGNAVRDERGRQVFRVRKHDIEEFHEIVTRHGCYKRDLEYFAERLLERAKAPLMAQAHGD